VTFAASSVGGCEGGIDEGGDVWPCPVAEGTVEDTVSGGTGDSDAGEAGVALVGAGFRDCATYLCC